MNWALSSRSLISVLFNQSWSFLNCLWNKFLKMQNGDICNSANKNKGKEQCTPVLLQIHFLQVNVLGDLAFHKPRRKSSGPCKLYLRSTVNNKSLLKGLGRHRKGPPTHKYTSVNWGAKISIATTRVGVTPGH